MNLQNRIEKLEQAHDGDACSHGYDLRDETQGKDVRPPVVCEVCGVPKTVFRVVYEGEE